LDLVALKIGVKISIQIHQKEEKRME